MRLLKTFIFSVFILGQMMAQSPQKMSFQSVFRQSDGKLAVDRIIGIKMSVLQGSTTGQIVFAEAHKTKTNANGLASLEIGSGKVITGSFSAIQWSTGPFFLQTEADLDGGNNYTLSGIHQLLSVPYALYAENGDKVISLTGSGSTTVSGSYPNFVISSTDNNTIYTGGAGISIVGTEIRNASPDKIVTLKGTGTTSVSGTYPDFTINSTGGTVSYSAGNGIAITGTEISNTSPDKIVTIRGTGTTSVSGTYPEFTINSTGGAINYSAGTGISIAGTEISNAAPDKIVDLKGVGATTVSGTYPNFTISSTDNNTIYNAGSGISIVGNTISNIAPDKSVNISAGQGISISGAYPDVTVSTTGNVPKHYVGELFGGGIVYYVYDNGEHGLIASLTDLSPSNRWYTGNSTTFATSYYDGLKNSNLITSVQGNFVTYAARTCRNYAGGGFSDWYLPTVWEMNIIFQNAYMISYKLLNDGNTATSPLQETSSYWTSTEFDNSLAYIFYMATGTPYLDTKDKGYYIRAVRRF